MHKSASKEPSEENTGQAGRLAGRLRRFFRSAAVQLIGLSLIVAMPLTLVGCRLLLFDGPATLPCGDEALLELFAWHALHGVQWEGHCSKGLFRNLGPLQFYAMAPLYWLTGYRYQGICLTAVTINVAAIVGVLVVIWRCTGRAAAVWSALLLMLYTGCIQTGILEESWPAVVTIWPFVLSVVLFAAVAAGRLAYLPAALLVSSYVVQTYVGYVPALTTVALVSLLLVSASKLRRWSGIHRAVSGNKRKVLLTCLAVTAAAWALPVIREIASPSSDFATLAGFFAGRGASHTWQETLKVWTWVLTCFPVGSITGRMELEQIGEVGVIHGVAACAQLVLLPLAYRLARRAGRDFEVGLCLLCLALLAAMTVSIRSIVGPILPHTVFWMSGLSLLIWMVVGGAFLHHLAGTLRIAQGGFGRRAVETVAWTAVAIGSVLGARKALTEISEIRGDTSILALVTPAQKLLSREKPSRCLVRIVDPEAWPAAAGLVLQLTKAGRFPVVDASWVMMFGSRHAQPPQPDGMLLVCTSHSGKHLRKMDGLQLLAETPYTLLFWQESPSKAEGRYSAAELQLLAWCWEGFWPVEGSGADSFCWSKGTESKCLIGLQKGRPYRLTISAAPLRVPGRTQRLTVGLNGQPVGEAALPRSGWQDLEFLLPATHVQGTNELVFRYAYARSPRSSPFQTDTRVLAVRFKNMDFERLE